MSTSSAYSELPTQHGPAFGYQGPSAVTELNDERPPLDRKTEAALAFAIVAPTVAGYAALAYGCFLAATTLF